MELAIFSCVNLIAETAARAEVRTFHKNKELHGLEHYAWNVQPNINQNAMQLRRELFARALYFGEALLVEVNGQMLVAQSFQRVEHATAPDCRQGGQTDRRPALQFQRIEAEVMQACETRLVLIRIQKARTTT